MLLLYGLTGYTGSLVARELVRGGISFVPGGRTKETVDQARTKLGVQAEPRAAALDAPDAMASMLSGISVVLNCAGPFARTAVPLARACLERGIHYLDLSGESAEHEAVLALGELAAAHGAMLLPGVGFGCVPTEVAAAEAVRRLGEPVAQLKIAYQTVGEASRGTLETVLKHLHEPGVQRASGALVSTRAAARAERVDFGEGPILVVTNPWRADVIGAFVSTAAPDIETLANFPLPARMLMRAPGFTGSGVGQWLVAKIIAGAKDGPSEEELEKGSTRVLAAATSASGRKASVLLKGPEAYVATARTAALAARTVLAGRSRAGFAAPSHILAFEDLSALGIDEVKA